MLLFIAACVLPSFFIAFLATWLMRSWSPKLGLVDQPAARKVHTTPTPLGGGVGIVLGFAIPVTLGLVAVSLLGKSDTLTSLIPAEVLSAIDLKGAQARVPQMAAILVAGLVLAIMGLMDDIKPLSWKGRLAVQFCLTIGLSFMGIQATVFASQPWFGQIITVIWLIVLINSFNFLDNMDALSSGIALIASIMFATIMLSQTGEPRWLVGGVLLILVGAIAGFLCHNWPPAKIFMGDAGSTFIGLMMGCTTILGTFYDETSGDTHVMLAPLCVLAVPLYDFASVILIRLRHGLSPFHPDKNHFSHRLVELGMSRPRAVFTIHFCTAATGLAGILLYQLSGWTAAAIVVAMVLCNLAIIAMLELASRQKNKQSG